MSARQTGPASEKRGVLPAGRASRAAFVLCAAGCALGVAPAPSAALTNGVIAYSTAGAVPSGIATINPSANRLLRFVIPSLGLPLDSADPAWSPDGMQLAFSSSLAGRQDIYVAPAGLFTLPRRITNDPAGAFDPTWSPDGKEIAFTSRRNSTTDIYAIDEAGAERRLTTDPGDDLSADWSTAGIAFDSARSGSRDIWVMAPDGSAQRRLTRTPTDEFDAAWSRDGRKLAFTRSRPGSNEREIRVLNGATRKTRTLVGPAVERRLPAWSPDGKQIAFNDNTALAVVPAGGLARGQAPTVLVNLGLDPVWAPLPPPIARVTGTVTITSRGVTAPVTDGRPIRTGALVDAIAGAIVVDFGRPAVAAAVERSTIAVEGARFAITKRSTENLTLSLKAPECPAGAQAASAQKARARGRARVKDSGQGGTGAIRNRDLNATPAGTEYSLIQSCRGTTVKARSGRVVVRERARSGRSGRHVLRAGEQVFVAKSR